MCGTALKKLSCLCIEHIISISSVFAYFGLNNFGEPFLASYDLQVIRDALLNCSSRLSLLDVITDA